LLPNLYPWQAKEVAEHGKDPKRALFVSPRLGKTRATAECMKLWPVERFLVVCPLIVAPVWEDLLGKLGMETFDLYSGSLKQRLGRLGKAGVAIANHDFLRPGADDLIGWAPQATICDESHMLASPSARRAKAFRRIAWRSDYVRLLTGTPAPNHYGNLWGQMVCLDKTEWGTSYERFAQRYLIRDAMFPSRVLGHRNVEELQERLQRYATFVRREDAFGPDSWQIVNRKVSMPPKAFSMYKTLVKDWVLEGENVQAQHVLKRLVRLQQLTSGFIPTDDGYTVEVHKAKINAVLEDLDEIVASGEKVVLFHRFKWEGEAYHDAIHERFKRIPVWQIDGSTPVVTRSRILRNFAEHQDSAVAVVQVQAGGVGVSFAEATHAFFVSRGFSFVDDEQAKDRIYKPGAARCVTRYEVPGTVDAYIAGILDRKQNVHEAVTNADFKAMAMGYIR